MDKRYDNRPSVISDPNKELCLNQKYAIVGLLCLIQGASPISAYSEEANNLVQSTIFSLGLSRTDVEKYLKSTMSNDPERIIRRINESLIEIKDKQYLGEIYKKCLRISDISGDVEMKTLVHSIFNELL